MAVTYRVISVPVTCAFGRPSASVKVKVALSPERIGLEDCGCDYADGCDECLRCVAQAAMQTVDTLRENQP